MLGGLCSCEDAFEIETLAQATLDREHNQTLLRLKKDVVKNMSFTIKPATLSRPSDAK
ncbi:hypothetical protein RO3G_10431 [Rhizopus delemar RA 99-880]|uniref:Uncharacterized protein n=1 Tax=Rhizopus delemar (strain RA 99-880 / ATCC MYA-4621 / FGSC 9543 / NRRL 43880) TaxID=246409 RepID=I1CB91_RHIO9|nr:hypothetical protein RO3G_10431 [Rhizopus delemar RA 99-880]|eukprot:EIE85721.1 hypothetical protein RO3G_10431 [Rhizopus delemar RA 99-880]